MHLVPIKYPLFVFLSFAHCFVQSQSIFNVLPDTDGQSSQLFDVYPDSNYIYVVGEIHDTSVVPPIYPIRAWWGKFDYNGNLLLKKVLSDSNNIMPITATASQILKKPNGNFVYAPKTYGESGYAECIILEIDSEGNIIKSKIIHNPFDSLSYIFPRWIAIDPIRPGKLILTTDLGINSVPRGCLFSIDDELNVIDTILIDYPGRNNAYSYVESETDSTFILVGQSRKKNDASDLPDIKPFFLRTNLKGGILDFNLAMGIPDKTVSFALLDNYSMKRDKYGNWLFAASSFQSEWHTFPYVFSYNADFTQMNWAFNFTPNKDDVNLSYHIIGGDFDTSRQSFLCVGFDALKPNGDTFIFKISAEGDSSWIRHFIPLNWSQEDVFYADLEEVIVTPHQSYISVGFAQHQDTSLWRSWAILLDTFGCFVPGCQNIVRNQDLEFADIGLFSIYPNPASTFVGLLCNREINDELKISVFDLNGEIVKSVNISPNIGYQYILNVSDWIKGMYVLRINSSDGKLLQTTPLIVN